MKMSSGICVEVNLHVCGDAISLFGRFYSEEINIDRLNISAISLREHHPQSRKTFVVPLESKQLESHQTKVRSD